MSEFFDKEEIFNKALKFYQKGEIFRAFIDKSELFPFEIKLKRITQKQIQKDFSKIYKEAKELLLLGSIAEQKEYEFKTIGRQKLPFRVVFKTKEEFLNFIKKRDEFTLWVYDFERITKEFQPLKELFYQKPFLVVEYHDRWNALLEICRYFYKNKSSNLYIRELDIENIDTKFIEKNKKTVDLLLSTIFANDPLGSLKEFAFEKRYGLKYPKELVRFRLLDKKLCGLSDITLPLDEFCSLELDIKRVFIVENKITTLSFPRVSASIVIFGKGYGVGILKAVEWLKDTEIFYWGDIDEDGFAILSQLRTYFPQTNSFLMDNDTVEKFLSLKVEHKNSCKNLKLPNLIHHEELVLKRVQSDFYGKNFRLEQERIPFWYLKDFIKGLS